MRYSTRFLLLATALCATAIAGMISVYRGFQYGIDDAYAEWGAADLVIDYMKAHEGQWPRSWNDLRDGFESTSGRVGGWSFEEFCSRILIDFDADPNELRRQSRSSDEPSFNVIRARYNTGVHFDDGPNSMLYDYFRSNDDVERSFQ